MTHRAFSRNASSSRAIPVKKMLDMVVTEPAMPVSFGRNQAGMQAGAEFVGDALTELQAIWIEAAKDACVHAERLMLRGVHKQVANRLLEPFQHISVVVTSSEWDNFFELRNHKDADPTIHALAEAMLKAVQGSVPKTLKPGEWHLPYVLSDELEQWTVETARKVSAARCCRVSYLNHDGTKTSLGKDLELCDMLVGARPLHASPFEHQASPDSKNWLRRWKNSKLHGNFKGWQQHRKLIERQFF